MDIEALVEAELKRRGIEIDATGEVAEQPRPAAEAIDIEAGSAEDQANAEAETAAAITAAKQERRQPQLERFFQIATPYPSEPAAITA